MMKVIAEQEHFLLVSDGEHFTVVERRAGKFYPLCNGIRNGVDLDDGTVAQLVRESGSYSERDARSGAGHRLVAGTGAAGTGGAFWLMSLCNGGIYSNTSAETSVGCPYWDPSFEFADLALHEM